MSYLQLLYHIVFRPKNSTPVIPIEHEEKLYRYIWGYIKGNGGILYRIGGMPDHIHLFVQIPPTISISDFMRGLKTSSSMFLSNHAEEFPKFQGWGKSYCAITHSALEKEKIINYIKGQKEHHKKVSFHDELLNILRECSIDVDMRYYMKE